MHRARQFYLKVHRTSVTYDVMRHRRTNANETPLCATCQHGKQVRRPTGTTLTTERSDKIRGIRNGKLEPGDEIAVDQYEVSKRG